MTVVFNPGFQGAGAGFENAQYPEPPLQTI